MRRFQAAPTAGVLYNRPPPKPTNENLPLEKVIYVLWRDPRQPLNDWCRALRSTLAEDLLALGARSVQVNVLDEWAQAGAAHIQGGAPLVEGTIQLWLDSANDSRRKPFDAAIAAVSWQMAAYLVSESVLRDDLPPAPQRGARTPCFAQMAMFRCLPTLSREQWWNIWRNEHSEVALATQGTFYRYAQNLVVRTLTFGAPAYDAIAEECLAEGALTDPHVFYGSDGDAGKLEQRRSDCMRSVARFIDFSAIVVIPTSQYRFE